MASVEITESHGFRRGDVVRLITEDNPRLHGLEATIVSFAEWGAHVATGVGSGRFRALFSEMEPVAKQPQLTNGKDHGVRTIHEGYTGDACTTCGSFRMRRTGSCSTCEDCGTNSGCA